MSDAATGTRAMVQRLSRKPAAVYVIGAPGVGKTTYMTRLLADYRRSEARRLHRQLWGEPLRPHGTRRPTGLHLGKTRAGFGGTDALGMAVNPDAVAWVRDVLPHFALDIYGEGQRLANMRFLSQLDEVARLTIVHLRADPAVLTERRQRRRNRQSEAWMRAAETRAANLAETATAAGLHVITYDTTKGAPPLWLHMEAAEASSPSPPS